MDILQNFIDTLSSIICCENIDFSYLIDHHKIQMSRLSRVSNSKFGDMNDIPVPDIELIKKLKEQIQELENKNKDLECKLDENSSNINTKTKTTPKTTCHICLTEPELPVWLNGYNIKNGKFETCSASQSSPSCLRCIRTEIDHVISSNKEKMKCWAGCHELRLNQPQKWRYYGEIGRTPECVPCPGLYKMMDNNKIGNTICRLCKEDCESVFELAKHIKYTCSYLRIKCKKCNLLVRKCDLNDHNKNCFNICVLCLRTEKKVVKVNVNKNNTTDHYCPHLPLAKCRVCQQPITQYNMKHHQKCQLLKKNNTINVLNKNG